MRWIPFFVGLLALLPSAFLRATSPSSFIITIDPGHGGSDNGAVYGKAREADITLNVAKLLQKNLNANHGVIAKLTRNKDITLSLPERVEISTGEKSDLFVSLHANASPDQRARGLEIYFQNQMAADEEAMYLAHLENQLVKDPHREADNNLEKKSDVLAIIEDLKKQANMKKSFSLSQVLLKNWLEDGTTKTHNIIRQAPFYVVSKTDAPAVLVELGFISNPKESLRLVQPSYQADLAARLAKGLLEYKEMIDKSKPPRLQ